MSEEKRQHEPASHIFYTYQMSRFSCGTRQHLRRFGLASQPLAKLGLDHAESRFDVTAFVIATQKQILSPCEYLLLPRTKPILYPWVKLYPWIKSGCFIAGPRRRSRTNDL